MQKAGKLMVLLTMFLLLASSLFASFAEENFCWSRLNAPYWHRDANCHFAETDWMTSDILGDETRRIDVSRAESEGQKPCPGCATEFAPTFTGEFPDWPHTLAPWGYEKGDMIEDDDWPRGVVELPADVLKTWGTPDEKLYELFPDAEDFEEGGKSVYPDDYAASLSTPAAAAPSCWSILRSSASPSGERYFRVNSGCCPPATVTTN